MTQPASLPNRSVLPLLATALLSLAVLSPLIVHHARRAQVDASIDVFFSADERSRGSFEKLESMMTERIACLVLLRFDGIFSDEGAALVHELGEALHEIEGTPCVYSLTCARRPVRSEGFSLNPAALVDFEPMCPSSTARTRSGGRSRRSSPTIHGRAICSSPGTGAGP